MKEAHRISIRAPLQKVFLAAADLTRWPEFLSHYRHNRFLSQTPSGGVVKMTCVQAGIRWTWTSQFQIDTERHELRFTHLQSTLNVSRGMEVVWKFEGRGDGSVEVVITHRLAVPWPFIGRFAANKIVGMALVQRIAEKNLAGLKRKAEAQQHAESSSADAKKPTRARRKTATARKPRRRAPSTFRTKPVAKKSIRKNAKERGPSKRKTPAKSAVVPPKKSKSIARKK